MNDQHIFVELFTPLSEKFKTTKISKKGHQKFCSIIEKLCPNAAYMR